MDNVYVQLSERFQVEDLAMMRSMRFFTPACLSSSSAITEDDIKEVCSFYHVESSVIIAELSEFRGLYNQLQSHVAMDDLTKLTSISSGGDIGIADEESIVR